MLSFYRTPREVYKCFLGKIDKRLGILCQFWSSDCKNILVVNDNVQPNSVELKIQIVLMEHYSELFIHVLQQLVPIKY